MKRDQIPTHLELAELADLEDGQARKVAVQGYLSDLVQRGIVGVPQPENRFSEGSKPVTAWEENGALRLETTPHLRTSDWDTKEDEWLLHY